MSKLQTLMENEGFDNIEKYLEEFVYDSVCPGICMNSLCDYSTNVEPDQDRGWCEICNTNTVKSGLMLAGIF